MNQRKPKFAPNQRQLAQTLGVSRQLIAWHAKQSGSPGRTDDGRYEIGPWREYFKGIGRVELREEHEPAKPDYMGVRIRFDDGVGNCMNGLFEIAGKSLASSLKKAGVVATRAQIAEAVLALYADSIPVMDKITTAWGFQPYSEPLDDGAIDYPNGVVSAAQALGRELPNCPDDIDDAGIEPFLPEL